MARPAEVEVLIALGSNLGERRSNLDGAVEALSNEPGVRVLMTSPWIETEPSSESISTWPPFAEPLASSAPKTLMSPSAERSMNPPNTGGS